MAVPVIIASAIGALASALPSLIFRALAALGIGYISYQGIGALLDQVKAFAGSSMGALSQYPFMGELAGFFMIDRHISIIFSAVTIKLALIGFDKASGAITRFGKK